MISRIIQDVCRMYADRGQSYLPKPKAEPLRRITLTEVWGRLYEGRSTIHLRFAFGQ